MLVNANCPYSHRDTAQYKEKGRKKLEFYALLHMGLTPSSFQQSEGRKFSFFPAEHGSDVDSIQFLLRQEGIKTNLEQKGVEILFPLYSVQDIFPQNKLRTLVLRKQTSRTERLSTRKGKKKDCNLLPGTGENLKNKGKKKKVG
jgi:hypothetical protein